MCLRQTTITLHFYDPLLHAYTVWETGTRHGEIQCLERVFTQTKLSNLKSYVHTIAYEIKACSALERLGRFWQW